MYLRSEVPGPSGREIATKQVRTEAGVPWGSVSRMVASGREKGILDVCMGWDLSSTARGGAKGKNSPVVQFKSGRDSGNTYNQV